MIAFSLMLKRRGLRRSAELARRNCSGAAPAVPRAKTLALRTKNREGERIAATSVRTGLAMTDSGPCSAVGGGALDAPLFSELQPAAGTATQNENPPL